MTHRCSGLLLSVSAEARSSDDVIAFEGPVLEAPRAFASSPFKGEENVVYIGGFDANFHNATNMAWIFKAGASTILGGGSEG